MTPTSVVRFTEPLTFAGVNVGDWVELEGSDPILANPAYGHFTPGRAYQVMGKGAGRYYNGEFLLMTRDRHARTGAEEDRMGGYYAGSFVKAAQDAVYFEKGDLVACVVSGGIEGDDDGEKQNFIEEGTYYRVKRYIHRPGRTGLLELRGVRGQWSTQRFNAPDKTLKAAIDDMVSKFPGSKIGSIRAWPDTQHFASTDSLADRWGVTVDDGVPLPNTTDTARTKQDMLDKVFGRAPEIERVMFHGFADGESVATRRAAGGIGDVRAYPDSNPKTAYGMKKPQMDKIPPVALLHMAEAMTEGARKYGPFNWRGNKVAASVYIGAAMRHLLSFADGEDNDPQPPAGSGASHLGHAMACLGILLDAKETGNLVDDRPTMGAFAEVARRMTKS